MSQSDPTVDDKTQSSNWTRQELVRWYCYAASPLIVYPFANWISTTRVGTFMPLSVFAFIYGLAFIVAFITLPYWLFRLLNKSKRASSKHYLIICVLFLPCFFVGLGTGSFIRMRGMDAFTQRSQSLVMAIKSYEATHSQPPSTLDQLVPNFLPEVPWTGMMAYPYYQYYVGPDAKNRFGGNPWALQVETPATSFDCILYFPLQNYPRQGHGGVLSRVHDWAYVHE